VQVEPNETDLPEVDFHLEDHGSIVLLRPVSAGAREWADMYIGEDNGYQPLWPTVTIEGRYVHSILEGIREDGLSYRSNGELQ
jgi:hypothetical protein